MLEILIYKSFVLVVWIYFAVSHDLQQYEGDSVLRLYFENLTEWNNLTSLLKEKELFHTVDIWNVGNKDRLFYDIYIRKKYMNITSYYIEKMHLDYVILIKNMKKFIEQPISRTVQRRKARNVENDYDIGNLVGVYPSFEEIESWIRVLQKTKSDYVELINLGKSHENRDMTLVKIGIKSVAKKPSIWIDSLMHAREWISAATSIYIIHKLLTSNQTETKNLLESLDWYFLIVANPDGYIYSQTEYRFWRKNRRKINKNCVGVDLNRNWNFKWKKNNHKFCGETYEGPSSESEIEVLNISRFLLKHKKKINAYISLHSYGQILMTRWAYSNSSHPADKHDQVKIAAEVTNAMSNVHQREYGFGTPGSLLYSYAGGSADWAYGAANIKYSYLLELRDTGVYGFLLPENEIIPTAEETWAGITVIAVQVITEYSQPKLNIREKTTHPSIKHDTSIKNQTSYHFMSSTKPMAKFHSIFVNNSDKKDNYKHYLQLLMLTLIYFFHNS